MGKTLYLECYSGISGDMTVASLLDLGADREKLKKALDSLPLEGFEIEVKRVKKAGLDACDFQVKLDAPYENHDHDMEYLHGHTHSHEDHPAGEPHHSHEHRGLGEVLEIIDRADLSERAKQTAVRIFQILAEAEAKAHGTTMEKVHFHEVGAVDSIVDIVAAAVCLDELDITEVIAPFVCEGRGTIRCQHGILPVPVPAVTNIIEAYQIPVNFTKVEGELVTPTGAAILAAIRTASALPDQFTLLGTGIGAGKRAYEGPGFLRAMLIAENRTRQSEKQDVIYKLETNIDDCTGEALGYVIERLMREGARDAHFTPVYMKKNRPAYMLTVICDETQIRKLEQIIFEETTTIGIRRARMERTVLKREDTSILLKEGEMKVKKCILPDGQVRHYPEYEDVAALARQSGLSFQQVMDVVRRTL